MRWTLPLLTASAALLASCTGVIDDPAGTGDGAGRRGGSRGPGDSCGAIELPAGALHRLTREQYDNTVRDLLGDDSRPARDFAADDNTEGFEVGLTVSPLLAEQYFDAAEEIAQRAVGDLDGLLPCDPATAGEEACAATFIREFAPRAWRRPLTGEELSRFDALYASVRADYDFPTAIQVVVTAALSSPWFLYHTEPVPEGATAGDVVEVTGHAMASRLSYLLWSSMPDDTLFAAAQAGELSTPEQVEAQARRMLDDPRAQVGVANFTRQWLSLDRIPLLEKDPDAVPEFDAALAQGLRDSLAAYVDFALWDTDGTVDSLLLSDTTFMTPQMADLYGLAGVEGDGPQAVSTGSAERRGLLTQPGLLALHSKPNQSDPIHRGLFVRERLLCQHLPPPPDDIVVRAPDPEPGLSTRERFAEHATNERCAGCHQLMDPIGFGFEAYDMVGRFRTTDEGMPVDTTGEVVAGEDASGAFDGVPELSRQLADSDAVRECIAKQLFRYTVGRTETDRDQCSLERVYEAGRESDWNIREMIVALTQTDAFLFRVVPEGGDL